MPKQKLVESILHDWVHELPFQMQALLLTAMRGPDENNKYSTAKAIIRYLRGLVCKPAGNWDYTNNNDFMWGDYTQFVHYSNVFCQDHDEYPHHFIMHVIHCAQVVGYKHPDNNIARYWADFYSSACKAFHTNPETMEEMDKRLNDFGVGAHNDNLLVIH